MPARHLPAMLRNARRAGREPEVPMNPSDSWQADCLNIASHNPFSDIVLYLLHRSHSDRLHNI